MNEHDDRPIVDTLGPLPLRPEAARRIRARLAVEVHARRALLVQGAIHGGFALAAVVWALAMVMPR